MRVALLLGATMLVACSGETISQGLEQPVRVPEAQFREGPLPGLPPLSPEEIRAGAVAETPAVTSVDITGLSIVAGEGEKTIRGRVSTDARAIALGFADDGDGYWLLPVGGPDPINNGEFTWSLTANVGGHVKPGYHTLLFAAVGADGESGRQVSSRLCVGSPIPDNLNSCDGARPPPALVVSLAWDRDVDLDLQVLSPNGKLTDAKRPSTDLESEDHDLDPSADGVGVLDRDSNADCVIDGLRRENLVFGERPRPGRYRVYASLAKPCGQRSTRFTLSLHSQVPGQDAGTFAQLETYRASGVLLASQADGGSMRGSFVTDFDVE